MRFAADEMNALSVTDWQSARTWTSNIVRNFIARLTNIVIICTWLQALLGHCRDPAPDSALLKPSTEQVAAEGRFARSGVALVVLEHALDVRRGVLYFLAGVLEG
jgi:hypothetical protein